MPHIHKPWRYVLALDLGLFNLAVILFAFIPPNTLILPELLFIVASSIAMIGVTCHAFECKSRWLKWSSWGYLLSGWIGVTMFMVYESIASGEGTPLAYQVGIGLFLLSGAASGYGAHLVDGGSRDRCRGYDCPNAGK